MLDYVIRSAALFDGTGEPGRRADVGIRDGCVAVVGRSTSPGPPSSTPPASSWPPA